MGRHHTGVADARRLGVGGVRSRGADPATKGGNAMNLQRSWYVFGRELKLSPRSPLVFFAIAMPFLITFLISSVFGSLFAVNPRLGIVDEGDSAVTAAAMQLDGVDTTVVVGADTLRSRVEAHDFDAGLVLPAGFDEAIRAGQNPVSYTHLRAHETVL